MEDIARTMKQREGGQEKKISKIVLIDIILRAVEENR
jgi:hypothetical protein